MPSGPDPGAADHCAGDAAAPTVPEAAAAAAAEGPEALDGVPQYMVRKARIVTGSHDPGVLRDFIFANLDQDDEFWATEVEALTLVRARSHTLAEGALERLRTAPPEALGALGVSAEAVNAAADILGLGTASPAPMPPELHARERPGGEWADVPVPDDDADDDLSPKKSARGLWATLRNVFRAAASLLAGTDAAQPLPTVFGPLADAITQNTALRSALDAQQVALAHALLGRQTGREEWLAGVGPGDLLEAFLVSVAPGADATSREAFLKGGVWARVAVHSAGHAQVGGAAKASRIVVVFDPSALPATHALHDAGCTGCAFEASTGADEASAFVLKKRGRTKVPLPDGSTEYMETVGQVCTKLSDVLRPCQEGLPDEASRALGWTPLALREGSAVEVCVSMQLAMRPKRPAAAGDGAGPGQAAECCLPYEPSTPSPKWLEGHIASFVDWIGGAKLIEVSLPRDMEKPSPDEAPSNWAAENSALLVWDFDPAWDADRLREALEVSICAAVAEAFPREVELAAQEKKDRGSLAEKVLKRMGFQRAHIQAAAAITGGDIRKAAVLLLTEFETVRLHAAEKAAQTRAEQGEEAPRVSRSERRGLVPVHLINTSRLIQRPGWAACAVLTMTKMPDYTSERILERLRSQPFPPAPPTPGTSAQAGVGEDDPGEALPPLALPPPAAPAPSRPLGAQWMRDMDFVRRPEVFVAPPVLDSGAGPSDAEQPNWRPAPTAATLSAVPGWAAQPSVLVCASRLPRSFRCAAAAELANSQPEALVDCRVTMQEKHTTRTTFGELVAYIPKRGQHVLVTDAGKVQLVDMRRQPTVAVDPVHPGVALHDHGVLAKLGTHMRSCIICFEAVEVAGYAEFCFKTYHVDGHTIDVRGPRHPMKVCRRCLKTHCDLMLREGRLYVPCPVAGCGRALQIRELEDIVDQAVYSELMSRLRHLEEREETGDDKDEVAFAGLELRQCPRCHVRIEKNMGCASMRCWRCGESFTWDSAVLVQTRFAPTATLAGTADGGSLPLLRTPGTFGREEGAFGRLPEAVPADSGSRLFAGPASSSGGQRPYLRVARSRRPTGPDSGSPATLEAALATASVPQGANGVLSGHGGSPGDPGLPSPAPQLADGGDEDDEDL